MADRDTLVTNLASRLGYRGTNLNSEIILEMQIVQDTKLESGPLYPWFLEVKGEALNTVASTQAVALSGLTYTFIAPLDNGGLWYYDPSQAADARWQKVVRGDYDELLQEFQDSTGAPKAYDLDADNILLFPTPDAVYNLRCSYYKKLTSFASNVTNGWTTYAADLVVALTGERMAKRLRDGGLIDIFKEEQNSAAARLLTAMTAREMLDREYLMGGED